MIKEKAEVIAESRHRERKTETDNSATVLIVRRDPKREKENNWRKEEKAAVHVN